MDYAALSSYRQLQPIERAFVDAYLSDLEGSAAKAGKKVVEFIRALGDDASEDETHDARFKVAAYHGDRMMQRPMVQAAIAERVDVLCKQMEIDAYKTLREVSSVAMASLADIVEFDHNALDDYDDSTYTQASFRLDKATPEQMAAVSSIKLDKKGRVVEIKMHDKLKALDMLMRYQGLYDLDNAQRAGINGKVEPARITQTMTTEDAASLYARQIADG